jgi:hypothetical protein
MGLMDKFKNLFTDEEIIEDEDEIEEEPVKIKEIKPEVKKEENKLPTFMREKIEKEENINKKNDDFVSDFSMNRNLGIDSEQVNNSYQKNEVNDNVSNKSVNSFKFPIEFEESDFTASSRASRHISRSKVPEKSKVVSKTREVPVVKKDVLKKETKVSELYKNKKKNKDIKKFQATPIISPVYGVLDKNYRTEELDPIIGDNYEVDRPSKNVDFDSVRKKAYGTLTDDIKDNLMCENCEYLKEAKACKKVKPEDNLMYEALCEKDDADNEEKRSKYKDVTLDEATENYFDYGVEYNKSNSLDDVKIVNHDEEPSPIKKNKNSIPPVKSSINLLSTLKKSMGDEEIGNNKNEEKSSGEQKKLELTDDLFNLIDSMYDEGKE